MKWRFVGMAPRNFRAMPDHEMLLVHYVNPDRQRKRYMGFDIVVPDPIAPSIARHVRVCEMDVEGLPVQLASHTYEDDTRAFYVPAAEDEPDAFEPQLPIYEGYWRSCENEQSSLPWPTPGTEWEGREQFLRCLDLAERGAEQLVYRGLSPCRICKCRNGHRAYLLGAWHWPEGFRHYVEAHLLRPSPSFEDFILNSQNAGESRAS